MADREELPVLELAPNVPVIVKPWRAKGVTTKYGPKLILTVKEGDAQSIVWLPLDLVNDLKTLGVVEIGKWDDGNPKYTVLKGAPDIVITKVHEAGEKNAHIEVALPGEDGGPEKPAKAPARPVEPRPTPTGTPAPDVMGGCVTEAITQAQRIAVGLGIENLLFHDPLVAAAVVEAAKSLASTLYIQRAR